MLIKIHKNRSVSSSGTWGTKNENNYEILNFEFPEELEEYNKRIVYYLGNQKVWDAIIDNKAILTNAITTKGSVKAYIWCTKSDEAFETDVDFRTQIFVMNFFENENADGIVPTPEQVDGFNTMLTAMNEKIEEIDELETTIENAETQRQENEETRQNNENTRQENEQTRQSQEAERERRTDEAIGNIEDKTAEYNANAEAKTNAFNQNATQKTNDFNSNYTQKVNDFNTNATTQKTDFNSNASSKTSAFNSNATNKTNDFNSNASSKTTAFNENATSKTNTFNSNANDKTSAFNDNATQKTTNFDNNASEKTDEFNTNAQNKINEYDEHIVEYQAQIDELQEEVEELSENMPWTETEQGTSIDITDAAKYSKNKLELFGNTSQNSTSGNTMTDTTNYSVEESGVSITSEPNGILTFNGTASANINKEYSSIIPQTYNIPSGTYYVHYRYISGTLTGRLITNLRGTGGTTSNQIVVYTDAYQTDKSVEKNISEDATITTAQIMILSGCILNNLKIQVWWSKSTATDYEPYTGGQPSPSPDYPQPIHVVTGNNSVGVQGKNLLYGSEVFHQIYYSGFNTIEGLATIDGQKYIFNSNGDNQCRAALVFNNLKPNTQYTISWKSIKGYNADGTDVSDRVYVSYIKEYTNENGLIVPVSGQTTGLTVTNNSATFTTDTKTEQAINLILGGSRIRRIIYDSLMIEESSVKTEYEPYTHTDYSLNLGSIELCKIGDYQDYLYKDGDNWYKYEMVQKIILDGHETYNLQTVKDITQVFRLVGVLQNPDPSNGLCNFLIYNLPGDVEKFALGNRNIYIALNKTRVTTIAEFKTWLATHNLIIYYNLVTPITTQITDNTLISQLEAIYNKIALVKGTNHITITPSDLAPYVTLNYMQDLPSKLDNLDSRLTLLE